MPPPGSRPCALCRRLVTLERLQQRVDELGRRTGTSALRRILQAWTPGALPDTVAEVRIVRGLVGSGLPPPVRQHEIRIEGDLLARVDLAYPEYRLAIELDSFRGHAGRRPFSQRPGSAESNRGGGLARLAGHALRHRRPG